MSYAPAAAKLATRVRSARAAPPWFTGWNWRLGLALTANAAVWGLVIVLLRLL